jgi:hypothetical protein
MSSHTHGWALSWAENLGVPINYDNDPINEIYVDHGVNFGGSLNLFGGYTQELEDRIEAALQAEIVWVQVRTFSIVSVSGNRRRKPSAPPTSKRTGSPSETVTLPRGLRLAA